MVALNISLRALKHPVTITSIVLLLLNDHVFKAAYPSVLTGKLSDLSGLFFFPFFLAAVLSLVLDHLRIRPRMTAAFAFGLTCLCFVLVKTWPPATALTTTAVSTLLHTPVRIVLDPSDVLALVVLWPGWRLWQRLEQASPTNVQAASKVGCLILALASVATLATSIAPAPRVARLAVSGEIVYARLVYIDQGGLGVVNGPPVIVRSQDDGRTWTRVDAGVVPLNAAEQLATNASLPITMCEPENPGTCYRITGKEQIEATQDGGQIWQVVWHVPAGRRKFLERVGGLNRDLGISPNDLVLISRNGTTRVAAQRASEESSFGHPKEHGSDPRCSKRSPCRTLAQT